jgi:hypothetical protein
LEADGGRRRTVIEIGVALRRPLPKLTVVREQRHCAMALKTGAPLKATHQTVEFRPSLSLPLFFLPPVCRLSLDSNPSDSREGHVMLVAARPILMSSTAGKGAS